MSMYNAASPSSRTPLPQVQLPINRYEAEAAVKSVLRGGCVGLQSGFRFPSWQFPYDDDVPIEERSMITVAEVMTPKVMVLHADATLQDAIAFLANQHVSGAPVVDALGHLVGAISSSDLMQAESEGTDLAVTAVEEVMTRKTLTVSPETELREAALTMEYGEVHRLFVQRGGELVGVISRSDVNRALATGRV
jgi:CBS domain-containing protein